jgi:hypothetical protein
MHSRRAANRSAPPLNCGVSRDIMRVAQAVLLSIVLTLVAVSLRHEQARAQRVTDDAVWWTYLATYDGLPGSTVVNLALKSRAPVPGYPMLVVTGVEYSSPPQNSGLPDSTELDSLNELSAKRLAVITQSTKVVFAGSFTHKGERLDYVYLADASGVEDRLRKFYATTVPSRANYISVKSDAEWAAYLDFLYPNEPTRRYYQSELKALGIEP